VGATRGQRGAAPRRGRRRRPARQQPRVTRAAAADDRARARSQAADGTYRYSGGEYFNESVPADARYADFMYKVGGQGGEGRVFFLGFMPSAHVRQAVGPGGLGRATARERGLAFGQTGGR
jgi:hypothetical protein